MNIEIKSLYRHFLDYAGASPDLPFFFDEERCYSVRESLWAVIAAANRLSEKGVRAGSLVALRTTRSVDAAILWLALQAIGAVAALTDPHNTVSGYLCALGMDFTPDFTLTNEEENGGIAASGGWRLNGEPVEIPCPALPAEPRFDTDIDITLPTNIIFTSGSTGRSKGVMLSQYNLVNHVAHYSFVGCYEADDVQMECLPIHHVFGLAVVFVGLIRRYRIFFPKTTDVKYVASCIEKYGITRLDGVPSYALMMARYKPESGLALRSLRVGVIAGAPMTDEQFRFIEDTLGIKILPVYGMSECIAISGSPKSEPREKRASTVGRPIPGYDVRITEEGEITVRCPVVTSGYYGDERATREAIDSEGYLHTGDLGYIDSDGFLVVSGRKKDIIIRNGENLSAVKIEQKIESLPYVRQAAVVGVRDERVGEVPCAMVVLSGEGDLKADLAEILTKPEYPARLIVAEHIPMTSSGKTDKAAVRELMIKYKEAEG